MYKILEIKERIALLTQHKIERDKRIADRITVVLWSDAGLTMNQIIYWVF